MSRSFRSWEMPYAARRRPGLSFWGWAALLLMTVSTQAAEDGDAFFEKNVRPILVERCYECHSTQAKKVRGGLNLETADGWKKGGDRGPAVVPGKPDESPLIEAVRYDDPDLRMPPKGKLSPREVQALTHWVALGAPDPRHGPAAQTSASKPKPIDVEAGRSFWAFRPPAEVVVPDVSDTSWSVTPLDRFILAKLEAKGISPVPPADRRTLIRRATLDLTGLPPTPEEVEAFVAARSPDAFAKVVDRLLASPRYGERWGRHWLDVARYADSNGLDENVAHGNAWRYRDYVIAAFNSDMPFDQFVTEQLAGDLLPDDGRRNERLTATGFLSLGPKVLAEVDETKMEMDIVDEQIDTVGRAFLGMTLGCARCHDHKFDPISTADYYALAGVFRSTKTMEHFKKVARWHENPLVDAKSRVALAAHEKTLADLKESIRKAVDAANEQLRGSSGPKAALPADAESRYPAATKTQIKKLRDELARLEKAGPEVPTAMGVGEGAVADVKVHLRGSHLTLGETVPRRVPVVLASSGQPSMPRDHSGRLELARWMTDPGHPLTARVIVNRVWRWHFGRGLVGSTDNFGKLGERPTHPELLDWLARRFENDGWSLKSLHRLILLSRTYQSGSRHDAKAAAVDPENLLHWRFTPRRLEAEAVRDAMLAASGVLDPAMGGSLLRVKNRDYFFDHTSKDVTSYDTNRRSVYLPVVRNHMFDGFDLFDYSDSGVSVGDRATTTVPTQALYLLNGGLVAQASEALARRVTAEASDAPGRLGRLYMRAYGRAPTAAEAERAERFLTRVEAGVSGLEPDAAARRLRAWQVLCHTVLASSEFLYIE
ncbi:MAG: PSD1 and planctomycete cytochrome C domain-containing protein [Isosphaeraceae bacterium]